MQRLILFALTALVLSSCTTDDEQLGTTEQGITFSLQQYLDCTYPAHQCYHHELGPADQLTCFIAGLKGRFANNASVGVKIFINASGQWELIATPAITDVFTTCISATQNRIFGSVHKPGASTTLLLGPATPNRRCFLTATYLETATPAYSDTLSTYKFSYLGSSNWFVGIAAQSNAVADASAVCVDVPSFVGDFTISHDQGGSVTQPLVPSYQTNNACGLRSLNGKWSEAVPPPYPGLLIYMFPDWVWTVYEHVGGVASCVSGTPN